MESFIVAGVRTPISRYGGALAKERPDDLAALVIREAVGRAGAGPARIDEVVLGAANQAREDNRNVARLATLLADFPRHGARPHRELAVRLRDGRQAPGCGRPS